MIFCNMVIFNILKNKNYFVEKNVVKNVKKSSKVGKNV